jgi:hypothetical protein
MLMVEPEVSTRDLGLILEAIALTKKSKPASRTG